MTENVSTGSIFDALIPQDIIKGWNDRRKSNTQVISGMMPFVQLIGIFNESEYEKMFSITDYETDDEGNTVASSSDHLFNRRAVYYKGEEGTNILGSINNTTGASEDASDDIMQTIRTQLQERFINLYIAEDRNADDNTYLAITPEEGILMAEAVPQTIDGTGGIGITDLQVENGINQFKTMTMRLTVNDPRILNNKPEYAKMSTLQGEFLIIYGWSNPSTVPGYDNSPPPIFEIDPQNSERLMMRVPTGNIDSGGYWAAQRMNVTGYDFAFNELGQMEISLKFMGKTQMFLATTRINTISNTWRRLMGTYDYRGDGSENSNAFANIKITKDDGTEVDLAQAALEEQSSYFRDLASVAGSTTNLATANLTLGGNNKTLNQALSEIDSEIKTLSKDEKDEQAETLLRRRAERESLGYPYAPGISVSRKKIRYVKPEDTGLEETEVVDDGEDPEEEANPDEETNNTVPVTDYESKLVYYYLGWVMDGIKLGISDRNRASTLAGERRIIPKFAYMSTTPDSNITSAFQSQVRRANSTEINERIQNAVIRLKEKCMPPFRVRGNRVDTAIAEITSDTRRTLTSQNYFPCLGIARMDGLQTQNKRDMTAILFPTPVGAPVELPHRGFIRVINFLATQPGPLTDDDNDENYAFVEKLRQHDEANNTNFEDLAKTTSSFNGRTGIHSFFVPDWYQYYDDEGNPTGGSLNGFDPTNPSDYMAADRNGKFYYVVSYVVTFKERSDNRGATFQENYTRVVEVDEYRQQNAEIWNLTQRKWYNLYVKYLGDYFEQLIRQRIAELQEEGRSVEEIYDEPIDLDFLTGKVYDNGRFMADYGIDNTDGGGDVTTKKRFGGYDTLTSIPERPDIPSLPIDEDLLEAVSILESRLDSLSEERVSNQTALDELSENILEKVNQIKTLQSIENANIFDSENAGIEQLTGGRYSRNAFNADGTLKTDAEMTIEELGSGVSRVRARTNYGYSGEPTQRDAAGNNIFSGFSNFLRNQEGNFDENTGENQTLIVLNNAQDNQTPIVTKEYILYAFYGLRTDNFERIDGDGGGEQTNFINNSTAESILLDIGPERFFEDGLDLTGDGIVNYDDFFKLVDMGEDVSGYQEERLNKIVEEFQGFVNRKLAQISRLNNELDPLYIRYEYHNSNLNAVESQIADINTKLVQYRGFYTENNRAESLSPYDDTSAFDDVLEIPMGRAQPMRLTTKVAQQWYRMFGPLLQNGVGDINNYGPAKGGTCYFPPSNIKTFRYDERKGGHNVTTFPKIVLDPLGYQRAVRARFENINLSLQEDAETSGTNDGQFAFLNWQLFGNPTAPNDPNFVNGNEYGFRSGPREEEFDNEGNLVRVTGGSYVKDYQAFLDLFNVQIDSTLPDEYTIVGTWPTRYVNGVLSDIPYHMIDEENNIIVERSDNPGTFRTTGWYLESAALPVYLYPSRRMATQIDPTKTTVAMPNGTPNGNYGLSEPEQPMGFNRPTDDGTGGGHYKDIRKDGDRNGLYNQLGRLFDQRFDNKDPTTLTKNRQEGWSDINADVVKEHRMKPGRAGAPVVNTGTPANPILKKRINFTYTYDDEVVDDVIIQGTTFEDDQADLTTYGSRIAANEHCPNLTLDMKRALVIKRKNWYKQYDVKGATGRWEEKAYWSLGHDDPSRVGGSPGSAGASRIDTRRLTKRVTILGKEKVFNYWVVKEDQFAGTSRMIPVYARPGTTTPSLDAYERDGNNTINVPSDDEDFDILALYKPKRDSTVQGPRVDKTKGYTNQYYPYGTGQYVNNRDYRGSAQVPERRPNLNWLFIGDLLDRLPGRGFFTRINNNNNSPSMLLPNGEIVDGEELNVGFVKFIIENVLAPLPQNRRIGSRSGRNIPKGRLKVINKKGVGDHDEWRISDVTYGHLFRPEENDDENDDEVLNNNPQFGDLSNFTIDNVSDIPIRRDVIENLMNKQNSNMSIFQFMQQIMRPDSIGVDGKNINVGFRTRPDGVMEVFPATKNWRNTARQSTSEIDEAIFRNRYPEENLLLDYKKDDSLIERIDMNSKFDPGMTMTFELGARAFAGDPNKFVQFISYGNVAVELRDFLVAEDPRFKGIVEIADQNASGEAGRVTIAKNAFFAEGEGNTPTVPASLITKFLMNNPERMAKLNAMLVAESGSNFATQLLSNYMRKTTITIHGTTNLFPSSTIHIRGVVPQLEGMYLITTVRESITPSGFQTILEATLIENRNLDATGEVV